MKKITTLLLAIYLPIICCHAMEYNNSEESPIQSGSPTEALLDFLKAAVNEDAQAALDHTAGTRKYVLENKPNAMEELFERVPELDFDSSILWIEMPREGSVVVSVEVLIKESTERFQTRRVLKKIDGVWKVTT